MKHFVLITMIILCTFDTYSNSIIGDWEGEFRVSATGLAMRAKFNERDNEIIGYLDIPQQQAYGLRLTNVWQMENVVNFELIVGESNVAKFNGIIEGDSIGGRFSQMAFEGTFFLKRVVKNINPEDMLYTEEEVTFKSGNITLAGTLTIPKGEGKFPAAILITGSGPQNRDEEVFGFKVFGVLADHLSSNGIAVLRFDDRGIGGSSGDLDTSTTEHFADDAYAAFKFLEKHPKINPNKIGLIGHSEGALVGAMVAAKEKKVAYLIYLAGPGVRGKEIILSQVKTMLDQVEMSEADKKSALELQKRILDAVIAGKSLEPFKDEILNFRLQQFKQYDKSGAPIKPEFIENIKQGIDRELYALTGRWYKFFLSYNPQDALKKVKCPVLALFGGKDQQILVDLNRAPIENALAQAKNKDFTVKVFPLANHLFQKAETGAVGEYETLPKDFIPEFKELLVLWIKEKTR